jgi:hypothetical protein
LHGLEPVVRGELQTTLQGANGSPALVEDVA